MKKTFLFLAVLFLMTSCSDAQRGNFFMWQNAAKTCDQYNVGDVYQGGKIAYFFQSGDVGYIAGECHGIIAAETDQDSSGTTWGTYTLISGTSSAIGSGLTNTNAIVANQGAGTYAARLCYDLVLNGYSDWFLPSKDELSILYINRTVIGNFVTGGFSNGGYWSSTEDNTTQSCTHQFDTNHQGSSIKLSPYFHVRAIRYF